MTNKKLTEPCPNCKGQGVKITRGNHPSISTERKCYRCRGECTIPSLVGHTLCIDVATKEGSVFKFNAILHKAYTAEELHLQQKEFYLEHRTTKDLPPLPHFEVELLAMDDGLLKANAEYQKNHQNPLLHIHNSNNNKPFMCWVGDLPTQDEAIKMLEVWCLGCIWSLQRFNAGEEKTDFAYVMQELKWDNNAFIERLAQEGIKIAETSY